MPANSQRSANQPLHDRLLPGVVALWRIQSIITLGLVFGIPSLIVGGLTIGGVIPTYLPISLLLVVGALLCLFSQWFAGVAYRNWGYLLDTRVFRIRRGVVFTREIHVPRDRIQHVDIEQGPIERRLGLTRLILFTAGTKAAEQVIPGLNKKVAEALRDELIQHSTNSHGF